MNKTCWVVVVFVTSFNQFQDKHSKENSKTLKQRMASIRALENKINQVLQVLEKLNNRLDVKDEKFKKFHTKLQNMKTSFNAKICELEEAIEKKADTILVENFDNRLNLLEKANHDQELTALMQESYEKRLNILIHGLDENSNTPWEKNEEIVQIVNDFLRGLQITNPESIPLVDMHRLLQRPIFRKGIRVKRPIIIKLTKVADKRLIYSRLRNLKCYNEKQR